MLGFESSAGARREEPHPGAQFSLFDPQGWRHQVFITDTADPDIVYLEARHRTHARWVHDVLLVQWGVLVPHTVALAVCGTDRALRRTSRLEVSGLGGDPVVLTLVLDDGRVVEVAARSRDRMALAGPYLVAAISALPG